ncbi:MAG: hypothetical protein CFE34_01530 [Rhodobacteraceae bacterium PARR1]|nr:MAG: hypothetical protein CFE34_01530 [Rhodobacteraceae bacterium PARR1]
MQVRGASTSDTTRSLCVGPQHRILWHGWQEELLFDKPEVRVAAKLLINDQTTRREEGEAMSTARQTLLRKRGKSGDEVPCPQQRRKQGPKALVRTGPPRKTLLPTS